MRILVTGNRGFLGSALSTELNDHGEDVVGLDIIDGDDVFELPTVDSKIANCDLVIHLAFCNEIGRNLMASSNLLKAAKENGIRRIINLSSVDAMGIFKGEGKPDYFPIDEQQPCNPRTDYGISKKLSEDLFSMVGPREGMSITTLRPPGIWSEETYGKISKLRRLNPEFEWSPYWEYGAFVDIRDLVRLIQTIAHTEVAEGHEIYHVCADDITTSGKTSIDLAEGIYPDVPWTDRTEYDRVPYKGILKNDKIKKDFGWAPVYSWRKFTEEN